MPREYVLIIHEGENAQNVKLCRLGDVNGDGKIDVSDATEIQKFLAELVELTPERKQAADTNADGKVDVSDATQIQKFLAELVDHLG